MYGLQTLVDYIKNKVKNTLLMLFYYLLSLFKFIYLLTYFNISGGLCYQEETWCHRDMALHTLQGGKRFGS